MQRTTASSPGGDRAAIRIATGPEKDSPNKAYGRVRRKRREHQHFQLVVAKSAIRRIGDDERLDIRPQSLREFAQELTGAVDAREQEQKGAIEVTALNRCRTQLRAGPAGLFRRR